MAATTLQPAAGIAAPESCNSNMMLFTEQQWLLNATSDGHSDTHTLDLKVAPSSRSCRFVTCSCLPAKLDSREGGGSSSAVQAQRERQELFLEVTSWWDSMQGRKSSRSPNFRHKELSEPSGVDSLNYPAWMDAQLSALHTEITTKSSPGSSSSTLSSNPGTTAEVPECGRDMSAQAVSKLCEKGQLREAVDALGVLVQTDSHISTSLFYSVLKQCVAQKDLVLGRRVHDLCVKAGYESNRFLANHILRMYAFQGKLEEAMDVFTRVAKPDAFMWFSMISAYVKNGAARQAMQLYHEMRGSAVKLDSYVFVAALQACAKAADLESGRQVHADLLESGVPLNSFVCTCLVDMYAKCGKLEDARRVFDSVGTRDVVTWTAMIAGYAHHGLSQEALTLYARMEQEGLILANGVTYACLLKACASAGALQKGKQLHCQILDRGLLEGDLLVGNCLVDMYAKCGELEGARKVFDSLGSRDVVTWTAMIAGYAKCGRLEDARRLFDSMVTKNVVTWTAMIAGYAEHGLGQEALVLYARMEEGEGLILADGVTFACLLNACASTGALKEGQQLHSHILERGLLDDDMLVGSSLVDMYAKCGKLEDARRVFDSLACRNVVTWNTMIAGYAEHGIGQEALALYERMEHQAGILPDGVTFACLLKACARAAALQQGKLLHAQIVERGLLKDHIVVGNCLVEMYAKCGRLEEARTVFDEMPTKDAVTWNTMINGYGHSNEGYMAINCFQEMLQAGVQPSGATLTCLLVACSHKGLVNEGRQYFNSMIAHHGIRPTTEHYNCVVDLLGRAGHLDEAESMLLSSESNQVGLMSLLNACRCHRDVKRGARCFKSLVRLDPQNASAYVLMANIYADAGRWMDVERIERLRKLAGASKKPAMAGIEVNKRVHTFAVGERRDDISCKVQSTNVRIRAEGGHVPHTELVLKPLSEKGKEDELCGHAEKLALAFGLLNTPDGTPLLVTKNLRMCRDCHSSTEIMSRIERRQIVVRDAHRVHQFVGGSCSCGGRP